MMKKVGVLLFIGMFTAFLACNKDQVIVDIPVDDTDEKLDFDQPSHFPPPVDFSNNPLTKTGVELGRRLFYDPRLSADSTLSCAGCHEQQFNFADVNQFSTGIDGIQGDMNAMAIVNLAWQDFFFWNGRSESMEEQAFEPVINPIEMHDTWENVVKKLKRDSTYNYLFTKAFGENSITDENATKAIAQFERTMISANSKYDEGFLANPQFSNFTQEEYDGYIFFSTEVADCFHCHVEPLFGSYGVLQFENNGLDSIITPGLGRESVTGDTNDRGKFKIPTLRNIEFSMPYMHDGRFATLTEVVEHYDKGGHYTYTIDEAKMTKTDKDGNPGRNMTQYQKQALIAFLMTLSDYDFLQDTAFADPFK